MTDSVNQAERRVALKTDYHDCYDVWLDRPGSADVCFSRLAGDSWSVHRTQMFELFDVLGMFHPLYQKSAHFDASESIVVYSDPFSHCGEGKWLMTGEDALRGGLVESFASLFIPDFPGLSYRYFVAAGHGTWFEHWSTEDWRSNCGDGDLSPLSEDRGKLLNLPDIEAACRILRNPVYAIDFVARKVEGGVQLLAIDWNPAPRLAGTPAHDAMVARWGSNQGLARAISSAVVEVAELAGVDFIDNNQIHSSIRHNAAPGCLGDDHV